MKSSTQKIREHLGLDVAERVVPTGSMWPTIRVGDAIRFRRTDRAPKLGEVWVFEQGEVHVCHRVLWIRPASLLFKGDWVPRADGFIPRARLFGPLIEVRRGARWRPANRRRDRALGLALSAVGTAWLTGRGVLSRAKRRALG